MAVLDVRGGKPSFIMCTLSMSKRMGPSGKQWACTPYQWCMFGEEHCVHSDMHTDSLIWGVGVRGMGGSRLFWTLPASGLQVLAFGGILS